MTPATEATLQALSQVPCRCVGVPPSPIEGYFDSIGATTICADCHGTGRRFWRLTEACWNRNGVFNKYESGESWASATQIDHDHPDAHCQACHGTNRVLASSDLLERVIRSNLDLLHVPVTLYPDAPDRLLDDGVAALAAAVARETAGAEA